MFHKTNYCINLNPLYQVKLLFETRKGLFKKKKFKAKQRNFKMKMMFRHSKIQLTQREKRDKL